MRIDTRRPSLKLTNGPVKPWARRARVPESGVPMRPLAVTSACPAQEWPTRRPFKAIMRWFWDLDIVRPAWE